jgi:hypothetical protein
MFDLSEFSTGELIRHLAGRSDLPLLVHPETGRVDPDAFLVRRTLGAIVCNDLVPVFEDSAGVVWGGCITRGDTGNPWYGKYAYIGGVIGKGVTIADTAQYHSKVDLDFTIRLPLGANYPVRVSEYYPVDAGGNVREGFLPEWDKQSVGLLHLAFIEGVLNPKFGEKSGTKEALGFFLFDLNNCPPASEWAYGHRDGWREVVTRATELRDAGKLVLPKLPQ